MPQSKARFDLNNQIACANRAAFDAAGVTVISLVGPAGSGKTSLIETLATRLEGRIRTAAIIGDLAGQQQVERIARHGCQSIPVVTDNLTAANVQAAANELKLAELDLLLIEAEGNAQNRVEFDLGQHLRASVFSVAAGDDNATEYSFLIAGSDLVLLNKIDMLPLVSFDCKVFNQDVLRVKPRIPIIQVSVQSSQGIGQWAQWVSSHLPPRVRDRLASRR